MEEGMFAAIICLSAQASSAKDSGNAHGVAKQQPAGQPVPIDPIVMGAQDRRQLQLRTIGFDLILARLYQGQGHISKKKKKKFRWAMHFCICLRESVLCSDPCCPSSMKVRNSCMKGWVSFEQARCGMRAGTMAGAGKKVCFIHG